MRKIRLYVNVDSEQHEEYNQAAKRLGMPASAFIRLVANIGYRAVQENPEILLRGATE